MKKRMIELSMAILLLAGVFLLSKEGAVITSKESEEAKPVIIIDAGHGGDDPGVIGVDKLKEKEINLSISNKLKKLLEEEGYRIVMTRSKDEGLYQQGTNNKKVQDMQRRCALIKETKPVLTVSIHQNSYQEESVCGPQVFYFAHSNEGEKLAKNIQDQLNQQLDVVRPRIEKANSTYYLLKKSEGVLTIVETGFLTNKREAALLATEDYQDKVAKAVCDGIIDYLSSNKKSA